MKMRAGHKSSVLHLTLHEKWFFQILRGAKTEEYREYKPYWVIRLSNKTQYLSKVLFVNGYGRRRPWMLVEIKSIELDEIEKRFVIKLGNILETGNLKQVLY